MKATGFMVHQQDLARFHIVSKSPVISRPPTNATLQTGLDRARDQGLQIEPLARLFRLRSIGATARQEERWCDQPFSSVPRYRLHAALDFRWRISDRRFSAMNRR